MPLCSVKARFSVLGNTRGKSSCLHTANWSLKLLVLLKWSAGNVVRKATMCPLRDGGQYAPSARCVSGILEMMNIGQMLEHWVLWFLALLLSTDFVKKVFLLFPDVRRRGPHEKSIQVLVGYVQVSMTSLSVDQSILKMNPLFLSSFSVSSSALALVAI